MTEFPTILSYEEMKDYFLNHPDDLEAENFFRLERDYGVTPPLYSGVLEYVYSHIEEGALSPQPADTIHDWISRRNKLLDNAIKGRVIGEKFLTERRALYQDLPGGISLPSIPFVANALLMTHNFSDKTIKTVATAEENIRSISTYLDVLHLLSSEDFNSVYLMVRVKFHFMIGQDEDGVFGVAISHIDDLDEFFRRRTELVPSFYNELLEIL
jgi:hypothetical protein